MDKAFTDYTYALGFYEGLGRECRNEAMLDRARADMTAKRGLWLATLAADRYRYSMAPDARASLRRAGAGMTPL